MKNKINLIFILAIFVSGCSSLNLNEGAVDYRFVKADGNNKDDFDSRYFTTQNIPDNLEPIKANQSLSISLKQVFICDFRESGLTDWDFSDWFTTQKKCNESGSGGGINTRGEILIIANVFERDGKNIISFSDNKNKKGGRVVYYGNDVRESGQHLNFSFLPIYGPQTYNGNPIYISFNFQELDIEENIKAQAMLHELAALGGKAYPPAAPILGVLNSIGSTLLKSDTDDTELEYHAVFAAEGGHKDVYVPLLLPGDYVVIRKENRLEEINWSNLKLDRKTGKLQRCINNKCTNYIESTYFTFSINTYQNSLTLDAAQSVGEFLKNNENFSATKISEFIAASKNIGSNLKQIQDYNKIRNSLNKINKLNSVSEKKSEALKFSNYLCTSVKSEFESVPENKKTITHEQLDFIIEQLISRYSVNPEKTSRKNLYEKCSINAKALMTDLGI